MGSRIFISIMPLPIFYLFLIIIRQVFMETVYGVYYNKNIKFSTCYNQYDGQGSGRQK